jgi:hypothetical protein
MQRKEGRYLTFILPSVLFIFCAVIATGGRSIVIVTLTDLSLGCAVTVTQFPPRPPPSKTVHVEADIPASHLDEFERAIVEIVAGGRPRMDALVRDEASIHTRAMQALQTIEASIKAHPTTGQSRRLVRFIAGLYNGQDYPFDLTELRGLDTRLANACLDYLNYDRLGKTEVHKHLDKGDRDLHRWLEEYGIEPATARP